MRLFKKRPYFLHSGLVASSEVIYVWKCPVRELKKRGRGERIQEKGGRTLVIDYWMLETRYW
jgi:hypothetical protein